MSLLGKRARKQYKRPSKYARTQIRPYAGPTARQIAASQASKILSKIGELKGVDTDIDATSILATTNTNGNCFVLNLVQSGTGSWNRVGKKIRMKSIRLYGEIRYTYTDAATTGIIDSNALRMVVVYDKQPSGAAIPTFDAVFGHTLQAGTEQCGYLDPVRYDNTDRFRVLKDMRVQLNPPLFNGAAGSTDTTIQTYIFDQYVELKGLETIFSGQSTPMTISDVSTGGLYVYFRAAVASVGVNVVGISTNSFARLRYTDI